MHQIISQFINDIHQTTWLEFIAVIAGIASVIFSRKENILVYPVGMINTGIFIWLYITHGLYADASVNFYYTVMSIIGWVMWARKAEGKSVLHITASSKKDWIYSFIFFLSAGLFYISCSAGLPIVLSLLQIASHRVLHSPECG